jgi:alkanesulfonate monooxygenase SsuD/methylene tetrahydromethanopterin reductase-like flavin-dependent oxidoreductase (luciferase family)
VRLAFTVIVLPMHRTVPLAKQIATLDVLSRGRVVLGVGVGGREEDYRAFDAPYDRKRLRRLEAQVALMRRAWAGERVADALRTVEPRPVQPGGPPILAGAIFPDSIRRAARWADGISGFSFGPSADEIRMAYDRGKAHAIVVVAEGARYNAAALTEYTRLTGRPVMPPKWALGYHQCRWFS